MTLPTNKRIVPRYVGMKAGRHGESVSAQLLHQMKTRRGRRNLKSLLNSRKFSMKITSLDELFQDQIKDVYSAESQLVKALPKMAKAANSDELREAFESHLEETRGHVERLDKIGAALGIKLTGKKCKGMEGLIEEGKEGIEADGEEQLLDLALIAAAQRVEHYEISAYGSLRAVAEAMDNSEIIDLLQETLDEESAADEKLTKIAEEIYPSIQSDGEPSNESEEETASRSNGKRSRAKAKR
jgi:ferritin-like metal-binding protein YciE